MNTAVSKTVKDADINCRLNRLINLERLVKTFCCLNRLINLERLVKTFWLDSIMRYYSVASIGATPLQKLLTLLLVSLVFATAACGDDDEGKKTVDLFEPTKFGTYTFEGEPNIAADDALDFGDVPLGTTASRRIEIRNTGREDLKFGDLTISEGFELAGGLPDELEPGENAYLTVFYFSDDEYGKRGTIEIASNDPDTPIHIIELAANIKFPCIEVDTSELDFGLIEPGETRTRSVVLTNCSENARSEIQRTDIEVPREFVIGNVPQGVILEPGERHIVAVTFQPARPGVYEGELVFLTNEEMRPEHKVQLIGRGRSPDCPITVIDALEPTRGEVGTAQPVGEFNGRPLDRISLDASRSFDPEGGELEFFWTLVSKPTDSNAILEMGTEGPLNEIWMDIAGDYVVELTIASSLGLEGCETARLTLHAVSNEDIHLQLVWDTPNDPLQEDASGSDVDVHLLSPRPGARWNSAPWDCFWMNMEPDWGQPGGQDNPSLDRDDVDGLGPENINLDNPEANTTYSVGIHYFSDHGYGTAYTTVRIYIGGVLFKEILRRPLGDQDFWHVADIEWPSGQIVEVDQTYPTFP